MATVPWRVFRERVPRGDGGERDVQLRGARTRSPSTIGPPRRRPRARARRATRTASAGVFAGVGCVSLFPESVRAIEHVRDGGGGDGVRLVVGLNAPPVRVPSSKALSAPTIARGTPWGRRRASRTRARPRRGGGVVIARGRLRRRVVSLAADGRSAAPGVEPAAWELNERSATLKLPSTAGVMGVTAVVFGERGESTARRGARASPPRTSRRIPRRARSRRARRWWGNPARRPP